MKTDQQPPASVTEANDSRTEKREADCAATHGSEMAACPWCGMTPNDKDPLTEQKAVAYHFYAESKSHVVQCAYCGASGPIKDTGAEAIAAWNSVPRKSPNGDSTTDKP